MDLVTFAAQAAGGIIGAYLAGTLLPHRALGWIGPLLVGIVGGACAGLIATSYGAAPVTPAGGQNLDAAAILVQATAGAAGGALLALLTGLASSLVER